MNREAAKEYLSKVAGTEPGRARRLKLMALGVKWEQAHASRKFASVFLESVVDVLQGNPPDPKGSPYDPNDLQESIRLNAGNDDTLSTLHELINELEEAANG